jgi:hypothetical protein
MEMAAKAVLPRVHAMVVCDEIESGDEEDVYNLIGVRTSIQATSFPYTPTVVRIPPGYGA